jgi:hypothetical protein
MIHRVGFRVCRDVDVPFRILRFQESPEKPFYIKNLHKTSAEWREMNIGYMMSTNTAPEWQEEE